MTFSVPPRCSDDTPAYGPQSPALAAAWKTVAQPSTAPRPPPGRPRRPGSARRRAASSCGIAMPGQRADGQAALAEQPDDRRAQEAAAAGDQHGARLVSRSSQLPRGPDRQLLAEDLGVVADVDRERGVEQDRRDRPRCARSAAPSSSSSRRSRSRSVAVSGRDRLDAEDGHHPPVRGSTPDQGVRATSGWALKTPSQQMVKSVRVGQVHPVRLPAAEPEPAPVVAVAEVAHPVIERCPCSGRRSWPARWPRGGGSTRG